MRIELAGWSSKGLRCPDVEVNLRSASGAIPKVSLIQMPNGTGKTTTLRLLNATLSGSAEKWTVEAVRELRRPDEDVEKGVFQVTLLIDGKALTIELTLDFSLGQARYTTSNPGSGGIVHRWHVPPAVHKFMAPEFLKLFIFDGEFADKLLNSDLGEADRAVDALCQLYLLEHAATRTRDDWETKAKAATGKSASTLNRWRDQESQLKERQKHLVGAREAAELKSKALQGEVLDLQRKIDERMSNVEATRTRHEHAVLELNAAKASVASSSVNLMSAMRLPYALHPKLATQLTDLRDNLDRLRLPENTSAQFFDELLQEPFCICGNPMDEHAANKIRCEAKRYLDADDVGVINALKKDVEDFSRSTEDDAGFTRVTRLSNQLASDARREKTADGLVRALRQQLIDNGDDQLGLWQKQLEKHEADLAELQSFIRNIDGPGDPDEPDGQVKSLSEIKKRIKDIEGKIAEATATVLLRNQTDLIVQLLESAAKRARATIKSEIVDVCNSRLAKVLENDPLTIRKIDRSLRLLSQESASVGQNLSVGYTFLMSVLRRGNNDFPLVVDSPANPIDHGVRRRIGKLIPELCSQFVGFTINTERPGFVDSLEQHVSDIKFLTHFRITPGTERFMRSLPAGKFQQTSNAVLVEDRDYFYSFDLTDSGEVDAV